MGILLALLLGVAAAFFVLAMPIRMLETVTTVTRLSKLMVQAEPPISPNDRTLLSVLAGILTAGIGWVLVDWLVFGRAGMSTLIRTRDDDYEDEDEDHFRPTDPLDLVTPAAATTPDWTMPSSGDARRPLSARTDIGDPPPAGPLADPFGSGLAGINQALPPINDILPGAPISAPPLQPNAHPGALPPLVQPGSFPPAPTPGLHIEPGAGLPSSWPPLDEPQASAAPQPTELAPALRATLDAPPLAGLPSWMPAPGARPDGQPVEELPSAFYEDPAEPVVAEAQPVPLPDPVTPAIEEPAPLPVPPLLMPQDPFAPPSLSDVPPLAVQAFEPAPLPPQEVAPPPLAPQPFEAAPPIQAAPEPPAPPVAMPAPVAAPAPIAPQPPVQPAAPVAAAPMRPLPEPVIDRDRLEDLLGRLEKGLERRRAAAAAVHAQVAQPQPAPVPTQVAPAAQPTPVPSAPAAPVQVQPQPQPPQAVPMPAPAPAPASEPIIPAVPIAPALVIPQPAPAPVAPEPVRAMPPSGFAAPPPFAEPSILPLPVAANEAPQVAPQASSIPDEASILPVAAPSGLPDGQNDQLLDQPLHVTLDLLRSMVKR